MRKRDRDRECNPEHAAGDPADRRQPCDNMPHLGGRLQQLDFFSHMCPSSPLVAAVRVATLSVLVLAAGVMPAAAEGAGVVFGRVLDQTGAALADTTIDLVTGRSERT